MPCRFVLFVLLLVAPGLWAGVQAQPRNILVFIADDHGQDTGAYGNPVVKTPNLDRLAAEGTRFTEAFATTASCSASRSVILTGLHNHRTGQYGHEHSWHHFRSFDDLKSLPVLLAGAGYRTGQIGKYHVGPEPVFHFEEYIAGDSRNAYEMAENVRPFLASDDPRPFFLYMATSDPHRGGELDASRPFPDLVVRPDAFGNRKQGYDHITPVVYDPAKVVVPGWLPDTPATRAEIAEYYQAISRIDQGFGRLVEILKETGRYDNTLIIYMSDHGIAMPGAKTTVYEPGMRSPLLVRHPGAKRRGLVSNAMISWTDITPTLLDWAGVKPPVYKSTIDNPEVLRLLDAASEYGLHGRSFLGILEQERPQGWDEVYASHTFHEIQMYYPMRVVRDRQYKLIWNIASGLPFPFASDLWASATWQQVWQGGKGTKYAETGSGEVRPLPEAAMFREGRPDALYGVRTVQSYIMRPQFELYDIAKDPWEAHNLAYDPAYAEVLERYQARLRDFQSRTSDPWVLKWVYE